MKVNMDVFWKALRKVSGEKVTDEAIAEAITVLMLIGRHSAASWKSHRSTDVAATY